MLFRSVLVGRRLVRPCGTWWLCCRSMACKESISSTSSKMLRVQYLDADDKLKLILEDCNGGHHEFMRDKKENVGKALKRLELSAIKAKKRKKHNDGSAVPASVEAHLYTAAGDLVKDEICNVDAWVEDRTLEFGSVRYTVRVNPPVVLSLRLPIHFLTGCPVVPEVMLFKSDFSLCKWKWYRHPASSLGQRHASMSDHNFPLLSTSAAYWPTDDDVGHQLLLECTPTSEDGVEGEKQSILSNMIISKSPSDTPITRRHLLTPAQLAEPNVFRIVSYNTLASVFTEDEYAQNELYSYCDPGALQRGYRHAHLAHELMGYNADVMSLQEVGNSTYSKFLSHVLREKGYQGLHKQKSGKIHEGEAIFFNTSRFRLVDSHDIHLGSYIQNSLTCKELYEGLQADPILLGQACAKSAIVLISLLQSIDHPGHYLLLANTHLYYHPKGDHIRLIQTAILLNFLRCRLDAYRSGLERTAKVATVIAGDLNSCPCIAAYQYLVTGAIQKDHKDWMVHRSNQIPRCACYYKYNTNARDTKELPKYIKLKQEQETVPDSTFEGLDLQHGFHFENVTGTENLTNFTASFKAVLDYIMVDSDHLAVDRIIPLPSLEELSEFVALPSVYFPSDHLALVADLKWKS